MASNARDVMFKLLAVGAGIAGLFHVAGALGLLTNHTTPLWRDLLFIGINILLAWYFLRRPLWMFPAFLILYVQQTVSHGERAVRFWRQRDMIDYISAIDIAVLTLGLVLLLRDASDRRKARR